MVLFAQMILTISPEVPPVIRVRLAHLRKRKAALDELIRSVESYVAFDRLQAQAGGDRWLRKAPGSAGELSGGSRTQIPRRRSA
jgi:hypothetical protein